MSNNGNHLEKYTDIDTSRISDHDSVQRTRQRVLGERQRALLVQARQRFTAQQDNASFHYCPKCGEDLKAYMH